LDSVAALMATPAVTQTDTRGVDPSKWWMLLLLGALTVIVGIVALAFPGPTLLAVGLLFGCYLVIWAGGLLIVAFRGEGDSTALRILNGIIGIIGVFVGIALILRPGQSVYTVVLVLGIWWVMIGVLQLAAGFAVSERRAWNIVWGLIGLAAGVIILVNPEIGLVTLVWIVGIGLIVQGAIEIGVATALRKAAKGGET
jgi:uncharacterized membrane protein HdeD (DUF308 family)